MYSEGKVFIGMHRRLARVNLEMGSDIAVTDTPGGIIARQGAGATLQTMSRWGMLWWRVASFRLILA